MSMAVVMDISDRVTVLDRGRKIVEATPAEVQRNPEVIRAYLGSGGRQREATWITLQRHCRCV